MLLFYTMLMIVKGPSTQKHSQYYASHYDIIGDIGSLILQSPKKASQLRQSHREEVATLD